MTGPARLCAVSASLTDVGTVRTVNEDACLVQPLVGGGLWAVADGMGGHEAGDVASRMIVETLGEVRAPANLSELIDDVEARLIGVHRQLMEMAARADQPTTIGSTVAALLTYHRQAVSLWAGDSRVYRCRDGEFLCTTRDHSEAEELIAQGRLAPELAEQHPSGNVLTRAVGAYEELDLEIKFQELRRGDRFMVCSDGLYKELNDSDMAMLLARGSVTDACQSLVRLALDRGSRDNVTVVVVEFEEDP